jgi:integrase/recombinase XerD
VRTKVNISFWPRKKDRAGGAAFAPESPIYIVCRIAVTGKVGRVEAATGFETTYGNWRSAGEQGRVLGKSPADRHINTQLTKMVDTLNDFHADLERQGKVVTARAIYRLYKNNGAVLSLLELYEAFSQERQGLIGVEIAKASAAVTRVYYNKLSAFLQAHHLTDLRPEEFTHNQADKFMHWLLKEQSFKRNTANKHLQHIHQVLRWAIRREHLERNPMEHYKYKRVEAGEIKHLTAGELAKLSASPLPPCLDRVRDCFAFQCWTGLAYADLAALNVARDAEYHRDAQNALRRVLHIRRQKSTVHHGYECVIPLLPEAERILAKYGDELPVPSNQAYNRYLKEVGLTLGIEAEKMTTHVGRKTAGVMMLNLGIRMEVVSKFLGHSSVRMTEKVYAKILDKTLVNEFDRVFGGAGAVQGPGLSSAPTALPLPTQAQQRLLSRTQRDPSPLVVELPTDPAPSVGIWKRPPPVTSRPQV